MSSSNLVSMSTNVIIRIREKYSSSLCIKQQDKNTWDNKEILYVEGNCRSTKSPIATTNTTSNPMDEKANRTEIPRSFNDENNNYEIDDTSNHHNLTKLNRTKSKKQTNQARANNKFRHLAVNIIN